MAASFQLLEDQKEKPFAPNFSNEEGDRRNSSTI